VCGPKIFSGTLGKVMDPGGYVAEKANPNWLAAYKPFTGLHATAEAMKPPPAPTPYTAPPLAPYTPPASAYTPGAPSSLASLFDPNTPAIGAYANQDKTSNKVVK
jgi:hypothetical protein